jgi:lipopolysaccharide export system permease protein
MTFGAPVVTVPPGGTPVPASSAAPAVVTTGGAAVPAMPGTAGGVTGGTLLDIARMRVDDSRASMNGYDVEIQKKFALAVACIVFVLMGAPIALRFPRGGVGLVIGVSLGVFALYYCGLIAGESLANRGIIPASLAMWAANILFTAVGLVLLSRMGRESGSARGGGLGETLAGLRASLRRRRRSAA